MKIFFDGGCQPNPGNMEIGVFANDIFYHQKNLGSGTNNQAEWRALLYALRVAKNLGLKEPELWGDSTLVVNQANGVWKCESPDLRRYLAEFQEEVKWFTKVKITHVRRAENRAGIELEKALKS